MKELLRLERLCAKSVWDGSAFLTDAAGQLRLFEGRPVLNCGFALAWAARRRLDDLCAAEGAEPPAIGISSEYAEWSSIDPMAELMMSWDGLSWAEINASFLWHYGEEVGQVEPRNTTSIAPISE